MSAFDFADYKKYLRSALGKGRRSELARALRCHPAFISRVLNQDAQLSLEQAERVNAFLGHSELEARYFMQLVGKEKAGTVALKQYLSREIEQTRRQYHDLKHRYGEERERFDDEVARRYYGHWSYAALDLCLFTGLEKDVPSAAKRLGIAVAAAERKVRDLLEWGVLKKRVDGTFEGAKHVHIAKDSPHIARHHMNWRHKAMENMGEGAGEASLHYTNAMVLSREDALKLESQLLDLAQKSVKLAKDSPSERLQVLCIDFFGV
jgi:hypothetical protein